ncbi:hypothetical protein PDESU_00758 [Pontiella desulfatans]|uniref:Uncharacterized protein n=1 Tax=Pontiella desulfatans TaxID=2750659 RepID=A0A6C2TXB2_PONDE|nr:hypothetical protein PDESU_00758 [Pontiella desulfatans]
MQKMIVNVSKGFDDMRPLFKATTPEERLDEVERLRLEAGKFIYEYPARLLRVLTAVRKI